MTDTPQQRYRKHMRRTNRCVNCGTPVLGRSRCLRCQDNLNQQARQRRAAKKGTA